MPWLTKFNLSTAVRLLCKVIDVEGIRGDVQGTHGGIELRGNEKFSSVQEECRVWNKWTMKTREKQQSSFTWKIAIIMAACVLFAHILNF